MSTDHGSDEPPADSNGPGYVATGREDVYPTTIERARRVYSVHVFQEQHLARGGFAVVYRGEMFGDRGEHSPVAIKVVNGLEEVQEKIFVREVERWKRLRHANVQPLYGITGSLGVKQFGIVSPLADNGNLVQFVSANPTINRLKLLEQVARGLQYLHREAKIIHGDLKGSNVLITAELCPRICDFGLSTVIEKGDTVTATMIRRLGTAAFSAPELLDDRAYQNTVLNADASTPVQRKLRSKTTQSDTFAFGRMIYEAYAGAAPWHGIDPAQIRKMVLQGAIPPRAVSNPCAVLLDDALWQLCTDCWAMDPSQRPDCRSILDTLRAIAGPTPSPDVQPMLNRARKLMSFLLCIWQGGSRKEKC